MMTSKSGIPDTFVQAKNALSGFTLLNCRKNIPGNDRMNLLISTNGKCKGGGGIFASAIVLSVSNEQHFRKNFMGVHEEVPFY